MMQLQEGENVIAVHRRHWWVFFVAILKVVMLAGVLIGLVIASDRYVFWLSFVTREMLSLGTFLLLELIWIVLFLIMTDYYLDMWIVTDRRLLFVELNGLFHRTVTSVDYRNIQDVSVTVGGIIPTLFNFGDVIVQSAGTFGKFYFHKVPHPNLVRDEILEMRNKFLSSIRA